MLEMWEMAGKLKEDNELKQYVDLNWRNSDKTSRFSSFLMPHESGLSEWGKGLKQLRKLFHLA